MTQLYEVKFSKDEIMVIESIALWAISLDKAKDKVVDHYNRQARAIQLMDEDTFKEWFLKK